MANQLYSVPSALVFRSWASNADPDAVIKRRLLLKNDSQRPLCFRLSLPQHPAFQVSGSLVPDAPGDVCNVTLPAAGSTSLTVTLLREHADEIECRDELCVRMADGWLYVPLVALRDTQQPEGGDPIERRTAPGDGEYWSDADSDDEQRKPSKPSVQRRSSPQGLARTGRGRSDGKLTAAAVTEADELDFYAELLKAGPPRAGAPARPANAGEPPSPSSTSSTPAARASHPPPTPQSASRPSSSYANVPGITQRFSRGAQVRMVRLDASPARAATPRAEARAEAASIAHVAPEWSDAPAHCDAEELAFYRSLLPPRAGAPPRRREGGGGVPVDPKASARAEARAAIKAGTYFVISGSVCDARGKEIGSVAEVLGQEHAQQGGAPGPHPAADPALDPAASLREVTSSSAKLSDLGHAKLGHHQPQPAYMRSDPAQLSALPAARKGQSKGRPDDRILGRGKGDILGLKGPLELKSSAVIKGGGTVVKSAAPKANYQLTEREMQANWDALC